MTTLTITSKGQVTLRKEILRHLGIGPGDKVNIDLLPDRTITFQAAEQQPTGSIENFIGMLTSKDGPILTIEAINEAAAAGWASAMDYEKDNEE